jgi:hypothetical protein
MPYPFHRSLGHSPAIRLTVVWMSICLAILIAFTLQFAVKSLASLFFSFGMETESPTLDFSLYRSALFFGLPYIAHFTICIVFGVYAARASRPIFILWIIACWMSLLNIPTLGLLLLPHPALLDIEQEDLIFFMTMSNLGAITGFIFGILASDIRKNGFWRKK